MYMSETLQPNQSERNWQGYFYLSVKRTKNGRICHLEICRKRQNHCKNAVYLLIKQHQNIQLLCVFCRKNIIYNMNVDSVLIYSLIK